MVQLISESIHSYTFVFTIGHKNIRYKGTAVDLPNTKDILTILEALIFEQFGSNSLPIGVESFFVAREIVDFHSLKKTLFLIYC